MADIQFAPDVEEIKHRRALAKALMEGRTSGNTQTVSGIAIQNSPFEGLANVLNTYRGTKMDRQASEDMDKLNAEEREAMAIVLSSKDAPEALQRLEATGNRRMMEKFGPALMQARNDESARERLLNPQEVAERGQTHDPAFDYYGDSKRVTKRNPVRDERPQRNVQFEDISVGNDLWQKYRINPDGTKAPEGSPFKKSADTSLLLRQDDKLDRATERFAARLEGAKVPQVNASITNLNDILGKYEQSGEEVPGMGYLKTLWGANFFLTPEGKDVKSGVQSVANDLLNMYSGLAVTLPEAERRALEEMRGGSFAAEDFTRAWPRIVQRYNQVVGNEVAGFAPEVVKTYSSRQGAVPLAPIKATFSGETGGGDGPVVGTVEGGYRFKGGNPADQNNWEKVTK